MRLGEGFYRLRKSNDNQFGNAIRLNWKRFPCKVSPCYSSVLLLTDHRVSHFWNPAFGAGHFSQRRWQKCFAWGPSSFQCLSHLWQWSFIFRTAAYYTCFREVKNIGVIVSEWFKTKNSSRRQHAFLSSNTSDSKRMRPPNSLPITSASDPLEASAPALQGNLSILSSDPARLHAD